MNPQKLYKDFCNELSKVKGVKATPDNNDTFESIDFMSAELNALKVNIYLKKDDDFVGISIDGVDTGYWHTDEASPETMKKLLEIAKQAVLGNYKFQTTKFMKRKEICFPIGNAWLCTRVAGPHSFHYNYRIRRRVN